MIDEVRRDEERRGVLCVCVEEFKIYIKKKIFISENNVPFVHMMYYMITIFLHMIEALMKIFLKRGE